MEKKKIITIISTGVGIILFSVILIVILVSCNNKKSNKNRTTKRTTTKDNTTITTKNDVYFDVSFRYKNKEGEKTYIMPVKEKGIPTFDKDLNEFFNLPDDVVAVGFDRPLEKINNEGYIFELVEAKVEYGDGDTCILKEIYYGTPSTRFVVPNFITDIDEHFFDSFNPSSLSWEENSKMTKLKSNTLKNQHLLRTVTIPGEIKEIETTAFYNCPNLVDIILLDGVEKIDTSAFHMNEEHIYGYRDHIVIPSSVKTIGDHVFGKDIKITDIYYNGTFKDWAEIDFSSQLANPMYYAEYLYILDENGSRTYNNTKYSGVNDITFPNDLTTIKDYTFTNFKFNSITLPMNISKINGHPFKGCTSNLIMQNGTNYIAIEDEVFMGYAGTSITLANNIDSIGEKTFGECLNITSIVIPDSVTYIGEGAFAGCTSLESITLPFIGDCIHKDTELDKKPFGHLFGTTYYDDATLTSQNEVVNGSTVSVNYYIPDSLREVFITGTGDIVSYAFMNCDQLTTIEIVDGVSNIGKQAFFNCKKLRSFVMPNSIEKVGVEAFYKCSKLESINISTSMTTLENKAFASCSSLTSLVIPDNITSMANTSIDNCSSLKKLVIGNGFKSLGVILFTNYTLESLTIPFVGERTTDPEYGLDFLWGFQPVADSLKELIVTGGTTLAEGAFADCSSIERIVLPNSIQSIPKATFKGCSSLVSLTLPFIGDQRYTPTTKIQYPLGYMFGDEEFSGSTETEQTYYNGNYVSISHFYIPDSLREVNVTDCTTMPMGSFENCKYITTVWLDKVTYMASSVFSGCTNLTNVTLPNSVEKILGSCFCDCTNLTYVRLPLNLVAMYDRIFMNCTSLTTVLIEKNLTKIDDRTFNGCTNLEKVYYKGDSTDWDEMTIGNLNEGLDNATIYYYSKNQPTETGHYWHYVDNEPVEW